MDDMETSDMTVQGGDLATYMSAGIVLVLCRSTWDLKTTGLVFGSSGRNHWSVLRFHVRLWGGSSSHLWTAVL